MELVRQHQDRHQIPRFTFHFQMTPHLLVVFFLWLGFASVSLSAVTFGHFATSSPNPFAAFADVFPGQPRSAVDARGFWCAASAYRYNLNDQCTFYPTKGTFSTIGVVIAEDVIDEVSFRLRDDTLRVGDLMLLWGKPGVAVYSHSVFLYWRAYSAIVIANHSGQFSLFLPVQRVTISNAVLITPA